MQIFSISDSLRPSFRRTSFHLAPISSRMQWKWSSVAGCLSLPSEDISQLKDSVWLTAKESAKKTYGGYKKIVWFYQLSCYCKLAAVKSSKADVSSFSPYDNQLMSLTHWGYRFLAFIGFVLLWWHCDRNCTRKLTTDGRCATLRILNKNLSTCLLIE